MRPKPVKIELPQFTPIFNGIMDYLDQGMTPTAFATYVALHIRCDYSSGIWKGTAAKIQNYFGGMASLRNIQRSLVELRKMGLIKYKDADARRKQYPILIHKYRVRIGPLKGYTLNAFAFSGLRWVTYDLCRGGDAVVALSRRGGDAVETLSRRGGDADVTTIQKDKRFKRVIVTKFDKSKLDFGTMTERDVAEVLAAPFGSLDDSTSTPEDSYLPDHAASGISDPEAPEDLEDLDPELNDPEPNPEEFTTDDFSEEDLEGADPDFDEEEPEESQSQPESKDLGYEEESKDTMRRISQSDAAVELAKKIYTHLGITPSDAVLYRAAEHIFHLIGTQGYHEVLAVIRWVLTVDDFWLEVMARGWDGVDCPVFGFVGRYDKVRTKALAHRAAAKTKKNADPNDDPRLRDPNHPMGRLMASIENRTL